MKSTQTVVFSILFLALVLFSCSKKKNDGPAKNTMTATIEGASFKATEVQAMKGAGALAIDGNGSAGQIALTIAIYNGPGTYDNIDASQSTANFLPATGSVTGYTASLGLGSPSIVITSESGNSVQGTFSFTGVGSDGTSVIHITNGQFNIQLSM